MKWALYPESSCLVHVSSLSSIVVCAVSLWLARVLNLNLNICLKVDLSSFFQLSAAIKRERKPLGLRWDVNVLNFSHEECWLNGSLCFFPGGRATEKILARARQLVDVKKEDGFSALHLAALNNHRDVAEILIKEVKTGANNYFETLFIRFNLFFFFFRYTFNKTFDFPHPSSCIGVSTYSFS